MDAHAERTTRVHWFSFRVRLPSLQGLASGGSSRGGEASTAAQPATAGKSTRWFGQLEQENQRMKKQDDRWMLTIQWSLVIESFVD